MSWPVLVNILTIILCAAVLVQSMRMMRSLKAIRDGAMTEMVTALDAATVQARRVLSELKTTLGECAGGAQAVIDAKAICDELTVMVGIANASAERMVEAANGARRFRDDDAFETERY